MPSGGIGGGVGARGRVLRLAEVGRQLHAGHIEELVHRRDGFHQPGEEVCGGAFSVGRGAVVPDGDLVDRPSDETLVKLGDLGGRRGNEDLQFIDMLQGFDIM